MVQKELQSQNLGSNTGETGTLEITGVGREWEPRNLLHPEQLPKAEVYRIFTIVYLLLMLRHLLRNTVRQGRHGDSHLKSWRSFKVEAGGSDI